MSHEDYGHEIDINRLPVLTARGDNWTHWRNSWSAAFRCMNLWDIIIGKELRPAPSEDNATAITDWDDRNVKALLMLTIAVHNDIGFLVSFHENAHDGWKTLAGRFDRDTENNFIHLFKIIVNLRFQDRGDLRTYTNNFDTKWLQMKHKCIHSSHPVAKAMKPIFESDEVKEAFLLASLPNSYRNIA